MKNLKKVFIVLTAFGTLTSCSSNSEDLSDKLTMDIGKSNAILIPAPATTLGCDQIAKGQTTAVTGTIAGAYFTLPSPIITWSVKDTTKPSEVRVLALKLSLKSPKIGGEYTCIFSDINLGSLYFKSEVTGETVQVSTWNGKLGEKAGNVYSTKSLMDSSVVGADNVLYPCDIKCGGINVAKGAGIFSVTGEWQLSAVRKQYATSNADETSYEETPIQISGSFTVDNVLK